MPRYAFIYRGGDTFETPEDGAAYMEKWRAWAASLGAAYVIPGMPFRATATVDGAGVSAGPRDPRLSGFSVVEADDIAAAQAMAQRCPHVAIGGDIVVAEGMDMEM
ncbi:MAG: YciI family protein [Pseudomonadota bacterium]